MVCVMFLLIFLTVFWFHFLCNGIDQSNRFLSLCLSYVSSLRWMLMRNSFPKFCRKCLNFCLSGILMVTHSLASCLCWPCGCDILQLILSCCIFLKKIIFGCHNIVVMFDAAQKCIYYCFFLIPWHLML